MLEIANIVHFFFFFFFSAWPNQSVATVTFLKMWASSPPLALTSHVTDSYSRQRHFNTHKYEHNCLANVSTSVGSHLPTFRTEAICFSAEPVHCCQQLNLFSRKNFSKCARDPSRQRSPHPTCWYSHEMSLSALTGSIPEKYFLLKSKVSFLPDLIFPCHSCNPRRRSSCFSLVVWQKRSSFSYIAKN